MVSLAASSQKFLKVTHLSFSIIWAGGALSSLILNLLAASSPGEQAHVIMSNVAMISKSLVAPGGIGCLLTGLAYSMFTKWGFAKHGWLVLKWLLFVLLMLSGILTPWQANLVQLLQQYGPNAIYLSEYGHNNLANIGLGIMRAVVLLILVVLSIYKPKRAKRSP